MLEKSPVNGRRGAQEPLAAKSNLPIPVEDERACRSRATPEPNQRPAREVTQMKLTSVERPFPAAEIQKGG
jgi:hypothetical protein